ncbi:MAG: Mov34/MPN/PAD-1 family protein [Candidatus Asgardarchaeia archaeon]
MGTDNVSMENDENNKVYPVYILSRVVSEIKRFCTYHLPNEALGVLIGYKMSFSGKQYTKIVDWATGETINSVAHAEFSQEGVLEYHLFISERYLDKKTRPRVVGVFHSHPFGIDPSFSSIDITTFSNPFYLEEGNVFMLLDPTIDVVKVFVVERDGKSFILNEREWCEYYPRVRRVDKYKEE